MFCMKCLTTFLNLSYHMFNLIQLHTTLKVLWFWLVSVSAYKGQLILKAFHGLLTSPKKRSYEFDLFAFLLFTANKSNSSIRFFGRIYGLLICFSVLSDLYLFPFDNSKIVKKFLTFTTLLCS